MTKKELLPKTLCRRYRSWEALSDVLESPGRTVPLGQRDDYIMFGGTMGRIDDFDKKRQNVHLYAWGCRLVVRPLLLRLNIGTGRFILAPVRPQP